ncbi:TonB family protein [Psychrobacter frigidicola]|uniref:TonB family protein n=1 Tax=Psychrobacter frigidicola TaxID=45611 RepID=A0A5C7A6U0_9GAMM|nr:energy transducer TonB [Psychrobacter frigidicola]TXD98415.1 TonB family protein [Psychrobacter frigidicola]
MGSTDFNAPPRKLTLIAIGAVVGLHVLTAMALVAMKPPAPIDEVRDTPPPIEIQMVTLPTDVAQPEQIELEPVEIEVAKVEENVEEVQENTEPEPLSISEPESKISPEPKAEPEPTIKLKPIVEPTLEPQPKSEPQSQPEPIVDAKPKLQTEPVVNTTTKTVVTKTKPKKVEPEPYINQNQPSQKFSQEPRVGNTTADDQLRYLAEQEQDNARNAARKHAREAKADSDARAKADSDARAKADSDARAKADSDARAKADSDARAKADAEAKAAAAASNAPVNFNASNANWAAAPSFSFPDRAKRGARSGDTFNLVLLLRVNKQGGIDSVSLAKSSGNSVLDREAQRQVRSGKFRPFQQNGVPVVGNVTLPISYAMP